MSKTCVYIRSLELNSQAKRDHERYMIGDKIETEGLFDQYPFDNFLMKVVDRTWNEKAQTLTIDIDFIMRIRTPAEVQNYLLNYCSPSWVFDKFGNDIGNIIIRMDIYRLFPEKKIENKADIFEKLDDECKREGKPSISTLMALFDLS
ncbi:hypothetical protein [Vibrio parahaemolyticus]|uniref:hypothetical protein n=1 Tax=Vibrio parahaemolyticus TaxID=670 RepID=UPI00226A06C4|nr:hypothetical protein [Vibrio parahaemolyticus]MCX8795787.1 hypothetical protein [Vibrio parahaemolyticus]